MNIEDILQMADAELHEMSVSGHRIMQRFHRIMDPHCYEMPDDIYGRNNIIQLAIDPCISIKSWPSMAKGLYADDESRAQAQMTFYQSLSDQMVNDYVKNLINIGVMKSYEDIVKNSPLIDITKCGEYDDSSKLSIPQIAFDDGEISFMRTHGWYSLYPVFKKFTIQENRKKFFHVELLSVNESEKTFTVRLSDYIGDRRQWIIRDSIDIKFSFADNNNGLGMEYDWSNYLIYEQIIAEYVDDMKWSPRHKQFWFDIFGVAPSKKLVHGIIKPDESCKNINRNVTPVNHTFNSQDDVFFVTKHFHVKIDVLGKGEDALNLIKTDIYDGILLGYLHDMCAINLRLFKYPKTEVEPSGGIKTYKFDNMTVKSNEPITIPSEHNIVK